MERCIKVIYVIAAIVCVSLFITGQIIIVLLHNKLKPDYPVHNDLVNEMNHINGIILGYAVFAIWFVLLITMILLISLICRHFGT